MEDLNKISSTRVGDDIHFLINGKDDRGIVVKMDHSYITVLKDNGKFQFIHINDTFFIKNIIVNKTWDDMDEVERYDALVKIHAPTPRYLAKKWNQLPNELREVLLASKIEGGKTSGSNYGVEVPKPDSIKDPETDEDYKASVRTEAIADQFKHDEVKPKNKKDIPDKAYKTIAAMQERADIEYGEEQDARLGLTPKPTDKNNPIEESHKKGEKKEEWNGQFNTKDDSPSRDSLASRQEFSSKDGQNEDKDYKSLSKTWEEWLEKEGGYGDGGTPATTRGRDSGYETFNPVYGKKQRHGGQTKDTEGTKMQEKC